MHDESSARDSSARRDFLLTTSGLTAASWLALTGSAQAAEVSPFLPLLSPGDTVLFQGDSITDAGRDRQQGDKVNSQPAFGGGYAWMAAAELLVSRPDDSLKFFNRGISGNKVFELAARWQEDCLALKPNVLSILIGVNDFWHTLKHGYEGTLEKYEGDYHQLLSRTRQALPDVKLVVCEPFVLRCGEITDEWFPAIEDYLAAAKRVADDAGARFVPFQSMFDQAVKYAPPEHWAADGVHPSPFGAALMAHAWLQAVGA
jgi:lysophospholipase L1-like esterase